MKRQKVSFEEFNRLVEKADNVVLFLPGMSSDASVEQTSTYILFHAEQVMEKYLVSHETKIYFDRRTGSYTLEDRAWGSADVTLLTYLVPAEISS